jgi:hypothetical protein
MPSTTSSALLIRPKRVADVASSLPMIVLGPAASAKSSMALPIQTAIAIPGLRGRDSSRIGRRSHFDRPKVRTVIGVVRRVLLGPDSTEIDSRSIGAGTCGPGPVPGSRGKLR